MTIKLALTLTFLLSVFSSILIAQNIKTASNGVKIDISKPYYNPDMTVIQDKLIVLEFEGGFDTKEGGQNYVKAFGNEAFVEAIENAEVSLKGSFGLSKKEALEILDESKHLEVLEQFNPGFYQFLVGIAEETKMPLEDIVLAVNDGLYFSVGLHKVREHALEELGFIKRGCTVVGFNNGLVGENNDNPTAYAGSTTLVKSVDDKIMVLTIGSPLVILMGMSENIGVVVNTIDAFFKGHSIEDGGVADAVVVMNALLTCKSVDEVIKVNKSTKMNVSLSVTFADKDGGLATIEFNGDQYVGNIVIQPRANEHYIAHTNHPRFQEDYIIRTWFDGDAGKANQMLANTIWRQQYAEQFLEASAEKNVEELQKLLRTYPVLVPGTNDADFRTTTSVIWDVKNQRAYIAPDRPDISDYETITW